ncbi:Por secretion system C-terminal sorting domain-containing protein [Reichenbachiella faecimaris]|uniref:Por secretion system C-terminal sorting domain-containing protein n=1 Tax=Reichenbachiella faecimaris TaxID=692418 RepID=A0A1W2G872_REIFA|nr:T9SS type A sorting domain-containing protein [Reichenbachiella faecimaris]SMD32867.1 Por secretion system C-terminal sorting domain-containing protein [Reichenbachiella faecimaris]
MKSILIIISVLIFSTEIEAATRYWDGDADSDWNNAVNWDGDVLPSNGDAIIIDVQLYSNSPTINMASIFSPGSITVEDSDTDSTPANAHLIINADITVFGRIVSSDHSVIDMTGGTILIGHDLDVLSGSIVTISTTLTQTTSSEDINIGSQNATILVQAGANVTGFDDIEYTDTTSDQAAFIQTGGTVVIDDDLKMYNSTGNLLQITGGSFTVTDNARIEQDNSTIEFSGDAFVQIATFRLGPSGGPAINNSSITIAGDAIVIIEEVLRLYGGGTDSSFEIQDNAILDVSDDIDDPDLITVEPTATLLENGVNLPVVLISFNVTIVGEAVNITWSTSSEYNNDYFEIYRSNDQKKDFIRIATIDGSGTSYQVLNYSVMDHEWSYGVNYYFLRQVDYDGERESYPIKSIEIPNQTFDPQLNVYPNPVTDGTSLNIKFDLGNKFDESNNFFAIKIHTKSGALIFNKSLSFSTQNIEINGLNLCSGTYLLTLEGIGTKYTHQFVSK